MSDTVTKLMALADDYALWSSESQTKAARQALEDELVKLFPPLTDEHVYKIVRSKQPHLSDTSAAWSQEVAECTYWLSAARGITGEQMKLPEPVGILHRGTGGAFRYGFPDSLKPVYAQPAGDHLLFTETQLRAEIERRDAVLRMALAALEEACGDRCNAEYNPCYAREAIKAIQEVLG